jgi:hypothetical protein
MHRNLAMAYPAKCHGLNFLQWLSISAELKLAEWNAFPNTVEFSEEAGSDCRTWS